MNNFLKIVEQFHENNPVELDFISKLTGSEPQDEVEHMLDFMYSNRHKKLEGLSYSLILAKTKKWDEKIQKISVSDTEIEGVDYEVYIDFGDGFKIVKLLSESCYQREGKLMSHCVGSYYGRDTTIYSLRDPKNNPHCTIEDGNQMKGKGNGSIDLKYVDYIVKFLEKTGMIVGENEMKNLGYYKLEKIDKDLTSDSLYNGYIHEGKLDTIKDRNGDQYLGLGLFNIKKYIEISHGEIKWNFNLSKILEYFFNYSTSATSGGYSTSSTSGGFSTSATSGYHSTSATSGDHSTSATSGGYSTSSTSGGFSTSATSGGFSTSATSGYHSTSATSGDWSTSATSGDWSTSATSGYHSTSATSGHYSVSATSGDHSTSATSGNWSTAIANGSNSIAVANGEGAMVQGKIGNYLIVSEYKKGNLVDVKCTKVDGDIIREDTLYILKDGIFTEFIG